jgi:GNAT superfamily N-acetyltransferase
MMPSCPLTPVRSASEAAQVARLAAEIWTAHYPPIIGAAQTAYMLARLQSSEAILDQIAAGMHYLLLGSPAAPAGYAAYRREDADTVFLSKLYVHASARGQGWARTTLDWIREHERPARIYLTVNRHNALALSAYARLDFAKTGEVSADIGGGYVMDDFILEWRDPERGPPAADCGDSAPPAADRG